MTIDDILQTYRIGSDETEGTTEYSLVRLEAKQALAELFEYVIGGDEYIEIEGMVGQSHKEINKSELRAEQRQRLDEVMGGGE